MLRFIEITSAIIGIVSFVWTIATALRSDQGFRILKTFAGCLVVITCMAVLYANAGYNFSWGNRETTVLADGAIEYRWTTWKGDDQHNLKHTRDSKGKLIVEIRIVNGLKNGVQKYWYTSGAVLAEQEYLGDKKHGRWTFWYESGQKMWTAQYVDGRYVGQIKSWNADGSTVGICTMKEGQPWDGNVAFLKVAADHPLDYRPWFTEICEYKGGVENGKSNSYYSDGKAKFAGEFVDGQRHGIWSFYYPSGIRMFQLEYSKGSQVGKQTAWNSDGSIRAVGELKEGKWVGEFVTLVSDGDNFSLEEPKKNESVPLKPNGTPEIETRRTSTVGSMLRAFKNAVPETIRSSGK